LGELIKLTKKRCSHVRAMRVAKALAATAVDVLTDASLLEEVKREFKHSELR